MPRKYKSIKEFGNKVNKATKDASGKVTLNTLFNQGFMSKYSSVKTIDQMFENAGIKIESEDDFNSLPKETIDNAVRRYTNFGSWEEMLNKAGEEYMGEEIKKHLR